MSRYYCSIYGPLIQSFIDHKRSLGFKYNHVEWTFLQFDRLACNRDETEITVSKELAEEWWKRRPAESEKTRSHRVCLINCFSGYLTHLGYPISHIMPLPKVVCTYTPYIFSKHEIATLLSLIDTLDVSFAHTNTGIYSAPALFRLLYGTGIRISEAFNLHCTDVDLQNNHLTLRNCKNGQDRLIPFSLSVSEVLKDYMRFRATLNLWTPSPYFFIKVTGERCSKDMAYNWFRKVLYQAGIPHGGKAFGPRVHDFRHTFSVHALASMAEAGVDLYYSLPILSQYLGHTSLESTDKYVRLTAEMYPALITGANKLYPYLFPELLNTADDEAN